MIEFFISHLETELVVPGGFETVAHAWDVEPFDEVENVDLPAALAFSGQESSDPSNADNRVKQRNNHEIWVYTIASIQDLDQMRNRLFDAALGWQYGGTWDALQHSRGQVRKISGNRIWWLDIFTTWHVISQQ